jgi:Domain of unknown function (DUF5134)
MGGPGWLTGIFTAVMIAVALIGASRLVLALWRRRRTELDADSVHVLMGVGMAGMLTPALNPLPYGVWEAVFGVGAVWFGARAAFDVASRWNCRHPLPHLVESGAMLFMFLLWGSIAHGASTGSMMGMGTTPGAGRFSLLTLVLALFTFGYVVWLSDRLPALTASRQVVTARQTVAVGQTVTADQPVTSGQVAAGGQTVTSGPHEQSGCGCGEGASCTCPETASCCGTAPDRQGQRPILAPRCAACYKIAMGVTMGYMLVLML